jgi:hypothetical protein
MMISSPLKTLENLGGKSHGTILPLGLERPGFFSPLCHKADTGHDFGYCIDNPFYQEKKMS